MRFVFAKKTDNLVRINVGGNHRIWVLPQDLIDLSHGLSIEH